MGTDRCYVSSPFAEIENGIQLINICMCFFTGYFLTVSCDSVNEMQEYSADDSKPDILRVWGTGLCPADDCQYHM